MKEFKVGDKFKVIGNLSANKDLEGNIGTVTDNLGKKHYKIKWDDGDVSENWTDEGDMELIKMKKQTIMQKVSTMMKKLLDADTQTLVKAGYINGDLELTEEGTEALRTILFVANKTEMVAAAQAEIDAEEKNK